MAFRRRRRVIRRRGRAGRVRRRVSRRRMSAGRGRGLRVGFRM